LSRAKKELHGGIMLFMQNMVRLFIILLFSFLSFSFPFIASAQELQQQSAPPAPKEEIMTGKVTEIMGQGEKDVQGKKYPYQNIKVQLLDGKDKDKVVTIKHGDQVTLRDDQTVTVGEKVVVSKMTSQVGTAYAVVDKYRLDGLLYIAIAFFVLILALNRWKGLGSIVGLAVSLFVIIAFIVPQILAGADPFWTIIMGAIVIMVTTMYLAHGFTKTTHIAIFATVIALFCVGLLAIVFVELARISGLGSEDAYALQFNQSMTINFKGLLLGGIIIGALGVLDDVTSGISVTVNELYKANPNFTFAELLKSGIRIGSEHIASLVNTLVLAYASVGLPIFLFVIINPTNQPLWAMINSEMVAEEIVRTLAGSIGLVLAVPITTFISAWILTTKMPETPQHNPQKPKMKRFHTKKP
jgi:uncharacterized membrane protein